MRPIVAYFAGPYTAPDPVINTHATVQAATATYVASKGSIVPVIPHLSMLWHAITPMPYEEWLRIDLAVLERCDVLVRLPGASSGADGEVAHAGECRIPVVLFDPNAPDPVTTLIQAIRKAVPRLDVMNGR